MTAFDESRRSAWDCRNRLAKWRLYPPEAAVGVISVKRSASDPNQPPSFLPQNEPFAMYGLAILILLPILGWWLIRSTRSLDRLATIVNENNVDLGFLSLKVRTSAFLLFSDVRFVLWLVRRKYQISMCRRLLAKLSMKRGGTISWSCQ